MGICASCLGLKRHSSQSQQRDETDPLLDDSPQAQYGGLGGEDVSQPDEEELRREREAFDQITAEAADNMIDVSHPSTTAFSQYFAQTGHNRHRDLGNEAHGPSKDTAPEAQEDDDEAVWLQSIRAAGLDSITEVKGLQAGALVMDIGQLHQNSAPSRQRRH